MIVLFAANHEGRRHANLMLDVFMRIGNEQEWFSSQKIWPIKEIISILFPEELHLAAILQSEIAQSNT